MIGAVTETISQAHPVRDFLSDTRGAVTVDWVVLTAALVGLGLAVMSVVSVGVQDTAEDIQDQLEASDIITTAFTPPVPAAQGLSYNQWAWNESAGPSIVAQHNCNGYNMSNGEEWRYCQRSPSGGGASTYYWLTADSEHLDGNAVEFE